MKPPTRPPDWLNACTDAESIGRLTSLRVDPTIGDLIVRCNNDYLNYEECGYRAKAAGLTPAELWFLVKLPRQTIRPITGLNDTAGQPFKFAVDDRMLRGLHRIDLLLGGTIKEQTQFPDTAGERERYLVSSLFEEAIASSQIEGAAVTREIAKEMLRSRRPPTKPDERMILNNYETIRFLNAQRDRPMTVELLLEIQARLTRDLLEKPDAGGRLRRADEKITVWDEEDQEARHVPPPADELPRRLEAMCRFANASPALDDAEFLHPALRAMILHFWLAYDHPFCDGNGRTARALFYWSMLRSGYWLVEYLSISAIIRKAQKQYYMAFLNTETDDNDLGYFLTYHVGVIERSIDELHSYLERKQGERRRIASTVAPSLFNDRQRAILSRALDHPETVFTYHSHAASHGISIPSARADLLDLEQHKLLRGNRRGRRFEFVAVGDLGRRLGELG